MKIHVMSILVFYLSNISLALLRPRLLDRYEELRKKINRIFNGKQGDEMFLNINEYEYPRTNETLRQIHKRQWLDYYECLKGTYAEARREKIIYPSALIALEGTSVTLKCQICVSPLEMHTPDLIMWYFNSSSRNGIIGGIVERTEHIVSSRDNQYIIMYNLKLEQAGVYWCEMGNTTGSAYYLHIDSDSEKINIVYSETAINAPQAASSWTVPEYDLKVHTVWTEWGPCSTCDAVGVKLRYGYCTISLLETSETSGRHIVNESASRSDVSRRAEREEYEWDRTVGSTNRTTAINEDLRMRLRTVLELFRNKLPCKSRFVPKRVWTIPAIENRRTEIMRRYCKIKCRKNVIFEIRDERGNVLESANNSAGIYSMLQGMPEPSPSVVRDIIYEKHNKRLKLVCPGNLNVDIPITWQINDKIIIPSRIKNQSNGRIHIDSQMHIIFRSLKFDDANIYSCWQENELAGIIKLHVTGEIEFRTNRYIISIGACLIISVFLIIFWRAFKGRMRYTMH